MRTNPIKTRESDIRDVIKATFEKFIPAIWYGCYDISRRFHGDYVQIKIPLFGNVDVSAVMHKNRLDVFYKDEVYVIDWYVDPRTKQFSNFLVSSNWGNETGSKHCFPTVITGLTGHLLQVV